ncbi:MAG: sugar ABC transporter substrate-binding protein [Clostridia bacterium]|nr:sugar ABC transporter substrate-binding protein [Clostridia bacterium]
MSRNLAFKAALAFTAAVAILGAGVLVSVEAAGPVQIDFWCSSNPQEIEFAKEVVSRWNSSNRDIKVKLSPLPASRSTEEVLLASIAARSTPDVVANVYPGVVSQFVAAGGLYRVDSFSDFMQFMQKRLPSGILEQYRSADGHYYQIPWKSNPIMLAYNVNMLKEAGVAPASLRTYTGFLSAAGKLTRDLNADGRIDRWMIYLNIEPIWWQRFFDFCTLYVAASGGGTLIDGGRAAFANERGVAVMQFLSDLFRQGYAPRSTFPGDVFLQAKVATFITGPWTIPYYESMKPKGFEYDFVPIPAPDNCSGKDMWTYGDPKNIGIFTTSKHPAEAWEFVKFMLSVENDALFMEMTSQIPFRKGLDSIQAFSATIKKQPLLAKFIQQSAFTRGADNVARLVEVYDAIAQEYQYCAVLGQERAREAIETAADRVNEILSGD